MTRVLELIISQTGDTVLETKGFSGAECLEASHFLERALGVSAVEHKTAEYYAATQAEQQVHE